MKTIQFTCTLLTDVILSSRAATDGFHESLDYIPGAKFLGITAGQLYDMDNKEQTLDLFHNGCVRFGDAHPINASGDYSYKVPASWQYIKGKDIQDDVYLHHLLGDAAKEALAKDGQQLKQARTGYFTANGQKGELLEVEQNFSIKSAYDATIYRASDQQMYGYFALKRGSVWKFSVRTDNDDYETLIVEALSGKKRMGRSSSAQYGLISIQHDKTISSTSTPKRLTAGRAYIYALSNWCFYDHSGSTTAQLDEVEHLGLPKGSKIDWSASQIRTRLYRTWNRKRSNRDPDRLIIEKGSVLILHLSQEANVAWHEQGIGGHRSEGFGQVIINPDFLFGEEKEGKLKLAFEGDAYLHYDRDISAAVEKGDDDESIIGFLKHKEEESDVFTLIDQRTNKFLKDYRKQFDLITSSQWGQVRNIANHVTDQTQLNDLLFHADFGICTGGQAEPYWRGCRDTLQKFIFTESNLADVSLAPLTAKIASEMAKAAQNKNRYGKSN